MVDITLAIAEIGQDDGMRILPANHLVYLVIRHSNTETVHFSRTEAVGDEHLEDTLSLALHHLRRHAFAGLLLVPLHLCVDSHPVFLDGYRVTVDDDDVRAGCTANEIETTRVLKNPDDTERNDENPEHDSGILPEFGHGTHSKTSCRDVKKRRVGRVLKTGRMQRTCFLKGPNIRPFRRICSWERQLPGEL
jgi:hypothetical protein